VLASHVHMRVCVRACAFTQWCGHCKNLAPEYEKVGATFKAGCVPGGRVLCWWAMVVVTWLVDSLPADPPPGPLHARPSLLALPRPLLPVHLPRNRVLVRAPAARVRVHRALPSPPPRPPCSCPPAVSDGVVIAKVDADAHSALGSRFGVSGFPTIKWFPKGSSKPEDFDGDRSASGIVKYVNGKLGLNRKLKEVPTAVTVLDEDTFDAVALDPSKDVLVEFYAPVRAFLLLLPPAAACRCLLLRARLLPLAACPCIVCVPRPFLCVNPLWEAVVRPLQGPCPQVRGGGQDLQGRAQRT
jgi:thiol-disulfide isomerase/thioredoxin